MKKYGIYIGILVVGLFLGWLLFANSSNQEAEHNHNEVAEANQLWTCSMHPQIMQPEPGNCPICGMDLIPADTGAEGLSPDEIKLTENALALANIQTTIVGENSSKENTLTLSGKIVENEKSNKVEASYFSGRIEHLTINTTGETIRKGELLATIYSPELFAAQQELITASSLKETQQELYQSVRNKLKLWKLSDAQIDQIEASGKVEQHMPVYATVSGIVLEKMVAQGDYIKQGQPLLKIADLNTVWALFDVYENQVELVKKGQEITVTTNAYPQKEFTLKIDFIDPTLDPTTRTVKLRVILNNKEGLLKTGMFVKGNVKSDLGNNQKTLTLPASAVLWTGERSVVYVKTNPDKPFFEMREVTLGHQLDDHYQVIDGLTSGDEVVTHGTFTIDAAAQLQGKKSMMNKTGGKTMTGHEGHNGHTNETSKEISHEINWDNALEKKFISLVNAYTDLKDAFVTSDARVASTKSESFRNALDSMTATEREKLKGHWKMLYTASMEITLLNAIDNQRIHFQRISDMMINLSKGFSKFEQTLYIQYCPMANNNNGAYWLSKEAQIRNPYFGDKMLRCGEVKQTL